MKKIILYLLILLIMLLYLWHQITFNTCLKFLEKYILQIECMMISLLGGITYCLKGLYRAKCVEKNWDENWVTWYYIRPIVSTITGLIVYLFLKAGLIILSAESLKEINHYSFLSISFIAGFNVDNFFKRIEAIVQAAFNINTSNLSKNKS